jgi:FlaA1/EpsC-like NDP-sugar epimerase
MQTRFTRLPVTRRIQFAADALVLINAFMVAYLLRFEFQIPRSEQIALLHQLPYVVLIQMAALSIAGVQAFIWRYVGMTELQTFLKATWGPAALVLILRLVLPVSLQVWRVPLSVIVMDAILAFVSVLGLRVLRRGVYEYRARHVPAPPVEARKPILLIGAGWAGVAVAREITDRNRTDLHIRGFVDDDLSKLGSVLDGIPVIGTTNDLPRLVAELHIDHVIITISEATRAQLKRIHETCDRIPVKARIIPAMHEIIDGTVNFTRIRDVQIEDLLGREPVELDECDIRAMVEDATVMVTGAGGSIGSELVRQLARFDAGQLLLVERCEFALYNIEREIRADRPDLRVHALIADAGDEPRMRRIMAEYSPSIVVHAAAHKHVPMMEFNAGEAIKNNVLATRVVGQLAGEYGVKVFVLISTDKAVRPRSVMGASKRMAELVVQMLSTRYATRYTAVRFGNVIGSAGSVIPLFREQIAKGGPVTVTHPDMTRYFMTIPEASQLVLQAAAIGAGSEIFILDMGEPVRILDLASDVITLTGLKPFDDIDIEFTGLRPGEKLFEELETSGENVEKTRHPKIFIGRIAAPGADEIEQAVEDLAFLSTRGLDDEIRLLLNAFLADADLEVSQSAAAPAAVPAALISPVNGAMPLRFEVSQ